MSPGGLNIVFSSLNITQGHRNDVLMKNKVCGGRKRCLETARLSLFREFEESMAPGAILMSSGINCDFKMVFVTKFQSIGHFDVA